MDIKTNQDLYRAVLQLGEEAGFRSRPLDEYLRALWMLASRRAEAAGSSPTEFFALLSEAGSAAAPPFDEKWEASYDSYTHEVSGFQGWEHRILRQIVDLREMQESGQLDSRHSYLGITSRRGGTWYNFRPTAFLECGVAGYFRGWSPVITGAEVTVVRVTGEIEKRPSEQYAEPPLPLERVTWDDFRDFLQFCQGYE